ncbi:MAG: rod shape-determining protein MreC [Chloroflexi bacterium]|nr:MAG: rod shape-determining protein MreC [Chloroflexota bacterium]
MTLTLRQTALLAGMFIVISLSLIVLDGRNRLDSMKELASGFITPISRTLTDLGDGIFRSGPSDSQLAAELAAVTAERDALVAEKALLLEQLQEMNVLREQLNVQQARPELSLLTADVIARDPRSTEKFIIIDKGSNDGVEVGMAVVSPHYLVGQVVAVEPSRARVILTIDTAFQVGARLQTTRDEGIVYGRWQLGGRLLMRHLRVDVQIAESELVVTSNKTARVPEGLVIGKALAVERHSLENETEIEVLPLVDFDNLQTVAVIVAGPGVDE